MTVDILIATAAGWMPERQHTLDAMLRQLDNEKTPYRTPVHVLASARPEHSSIWARRCWEWIAKSSASHVALLNDDLILHVGFRTVCEAMAIAVPDEPISLHTQPPAAADVVKDGHRWCRCYWYTGPAVILTPAIAASILNFDAPWHFLSRVNEDNVAIHWAYRNQRPFWCPIPAPVLHDTSTKSTLGYDGHDHRVPSVLWTEDRFQGLDLTDPQTWRVKPFESPPWIPNPWMSLEHLETVRRGLQAGRPPCFICLEHEGAMSRYPGEPMICVQCLKNGYAKTQQR